ncbi:MAG: acyl-CoA thioesterase II [Actinomycetota bacterium]|nr:acyl-CoA thioesterase II [Acidimicrobiia bacterium]MDQ3293301.1 acyl-CoA thioesterase II [Actinomycetota bacterium]
MTPTPPTPPTWDRAPVVDQVAVDGLVRLLDLETIEVNLFRGVSPDVSLQRVFGGQVAGQALVAAARTVDPEHGHVHSLHAYFLRPGDPSVPILYEVDRIRDGRSFTTRRVVAIQHGKAIFNLQSSFQKPEQGLEHQLPVPEGIPAPEELPTFRERWADRAALLGEWYTRPRPIDFRVDWTPQERDEPLPPRQHVWLRAAGLLPDDPILHACVLTYASDMTLLDTTLLPHGGTYQENELMMASLDHAMWFHRPFEADQWLLYAQDSPSASEARGLARGLVYTQDGALVASVVQEGLIRQVRR